jgi:carboxyl-terminal processing protease
MEISTKKVIFLALSVGVIGALLAAAVFGQAVQQDNVYKYLSVFSEVFSIVRTNYVDEVASDKLVDGAFRGATQAVDEFSYYVSPTDMPAYRAFLEPGEMLDPGVLLTKRFGYAFVIGVVPGSAAEKAGIKPGDFIEKVDGTDTEDMAVWQVLSALRGKNGATRTLVIVRGGATSREEISFSIEPAVEVELEEKSYGHVAYLKVVDFSGGTAERLERKLAEIRGAGTTGVILDLRGNSTGPIEESIRVADLFLAGGTITSISGRKVDEKAWQADKTTAFDGKVVVLTDGASAAGAEIVAAAISGNQRGQVVGLPTYGKAIVQRLVDLPSGGGLHITIGHYTRPDLEPISHEGVKPDVTVDRMAFDDKSSQDGEGKKKDPILEKALSLLEAPAEDKAAA